MYSVFRSRGFGVDIEGHVGESPHIVGAPNTLEKTWNSSAFPVAGTRHECKAHRGLGPGASIISVSGILRQAQYDNDA